MSDMPESWLGWGFFVFMLAWGVVLLVSCVIGCFLLSRETWQDSMLCWHWQRWRCRRSRRGRLMATPHKCPVCDGRAQIWQFLLRRNFFSYKGLSRRCVRFGAFLYVFVSLLCHMCDTGVHGS